MKTEVILHRQFNGESVRQLSKCAFLCATDITAIYNKIRVAEGKGKKELKHYFQLTSTIEFMEALCYEINQENSKGKNRSFYSNLLINKGISPKDLKMVKRGKDNAGTWLHPYLFIDYAMWLSPQFRAKVVIWVGDNLLHFRNASGDAYKSCNKALDKAFDIGNKYWEYAKVAKFVSKRIMDKEEPDQWNIASKDQLYQRDKLIQKIENACEFGNFTNIDDLLSKI